MLIGLGHLSIITQDQYPHNRQSESIGISLIAGRSPLSKITSSPLIAASTKSLKLAAASIASVRQLTIYHT